MPNIEIIARGVILKNGKVLLCQAKTRANWYFPGGHVEWGETGETALRRELGEETGAEITGPEFIGLNENAYDFQNETHQEVNLIFRAETAESDIEAKEDHLRYRWAALGDLEKEYVLPEGMKKAVLGWLKDGKIFYSRQ